MDLFCTKPTINDLQLAEPLYLIFDKYIGFLLDEDLDSKKVLDLVVCLGVDSCKEIDVVGQILRWATVAKSIRNNYEIWTDGLKFRIKKHYTNWVGTKTWKWIQDFNGFPMDHYSIISVQNTIYDCIKLDVAEKYGWRKVII